MSAEFFLDTNVLIYAFTEQDARKRIRSRELHELAIEGQGIVSFQVVQEFLNAAQKKFPARFTDDDLQEFLEQALGPLCAVLPSQELYLAGGCQTLYSEDLPAGRKIHGLEIKNPF